MDGRCRVIHVIRLLDQLLKARHIRLKGRDGRTVSSHDPCQIVRRGGLVREARELIAAVADGFRKLPGTGVTNFFCDGGGGVSANARAAQLMDAAFVIKERQFESLPGLAEIISPCANCRSGLGTRGQEERCAITGLSEYLARFLDDDSDDREGGTTS